MKKILIISVLAILVFTGTAYACTFQYRDDTQTKFGKEYLYYFHKKIMASQPVKIVFSGDSTTLGIGTSADQFHIDQIVKKSADKIGILGITMQNNGQSWKSAFDWQTTYVNDDISSLPDLLVLRWGINEPYYGRSADQFETSLRAGLAKIRASRSVNQLSILLMTPNSTTDANNGRDEAWHAKINPMIRKAARDYQCVFIDTNGIYPDSHNAGDWMDAPFGDSRHIHPQDVMNLWIGSEIVDTIFPTALRVFYGK